MEDETAREHWKAGLAGALITGRKVIWALGPLAATPRVVAMFAAYGAKKPLLITTGRGAGPVPDPDEADVVEIGLPEAATMTEDLRRQDRVVHEELPAHALAAIAAYDPEGEAVWWTGPFITPEPIAGRRVLNGRPREWIDLEDKMLVDAIWDEIGVPRAPSLLVDVEASQTAAAHAALGAADDGAGTVWTGDARDGYNGGGEFVRWVTDAADAAAALEWFAPRCDRLRIAPFLEGVPCSIHGCVLPDGVAAFRPMELSMLRTPERGFFYGGLGTTWDPPEADRAHMRDVVHRTGAWLRARVGYAGFFGIDGILTADGFVPTELNPRPSGGVATLGQQVDAAAFALLQAALVAGHDPGISAGELESWVLEVLDGERLLKPLVIAPVDGVVEPQDITVTWDGSALRPDPDGAWTIVAGPSSIGLFCMLRVPAAPVGLRTAEVNIALCAFTDEHLGTHVGPVTIAPDVRR